MADTSKNEDDSNTTAPLPDETPPSNQNEWRSLSPLSIERDAAGGVAIDDHRFLVIGGKVTDSNNDHFSSSVCFDSNTNKWEDSPVDMPTARAAFGVAIVGDRVYVLGGTDGRGSILSDLRSIDVPGSVLSAVAGRTWQLLAPMKQARQFFACASQATSIYAFGGIDENSDCLDTAVRYDIGANEWNELPPMPGGPRYGCAAGVVGNRIFVVGGLDKDYNALASTIVFDTSTQQWESRDDPTPMPAVPDMKIERYGLSVVSVDRFVVAIGGGGDGGDGGDTAEVLDTERNAWKISPKSMKTVRAFFAAGFLKLTNEIIVAGGISDDTADIIHFEKGLLPLIYGLKERGQDVKGDTPYGKDLLGLTIIAESLAEALVIKGLRPPFVLGVLGKWGRGKSFFFNLMLDHLAKIQRRPIDEAVKKTFAGHIYIVKFDAWTFSKGNIWSSLMYQILNSLNEQLQFEEQLKKEVVNGDVSTIEVFRDFSTSEIDYIKQNNKRIFKIMENIQKEGDLPSEYLQKAINIHYDEDQKKLKSIEKEIVEINQKQ